MEMQGFEGLLHGLMASKAGPLVVAVLGAELGLGQIGLGLMQPVARAVHAGVEVQKTSIRAQRR